MKSQRRDAKNAWELCGLRSVPVAEQASQRQWREVDAVLGASALKDKRLS